MMLTFDTIWDLWVNFEKCLGISRNFGVSYQ